MEGKVKVKGGGAGGEVMCDVLWNIYIYVLSNHSLINYICLTSILLRHSASVRERDFLFLSIYYVQRAADVLLYKNNLSLHVTRATQDTRLIATRLTCA